MAAHPRQVDQPLTTTQAAPVLGVSPHEVRRLCRLGLLPAQRVGRDWLIATQDALAYVRAPRGSVKRA